jgi:tetratricopeptide (TPR) repeat protein
VGEYEEAIKYYGKAIKKNPDDFKAYLGKANVLY